MPCKVFSMKKGFKYLFLLSNFTKIYILVKYLENIFLKDENNFVIKKVYIYILVIR